MTRYEALFKSLTKHKLQLRRCSILFRPSCFGSRRLDKIWRAISKRPMTTRWNSDAFWHLLASLTSERSYTRAREQFQTNTKFTRFYSATRPRIAADVSHDFFFSLLTPSAGNWFADHNERPEPCTIIRRFLLL